MYPIQNFLKNSLVSFITFAFAFVLTFSHVIVYDSVEHDLYASYVSQSTEECFDYDENDGDESCETLEKSARAPAQNEKDDAPEHLNTILFTDFLTYHTYSLKIHLIEMKNSVIYSDHSIYSDSFLNDILRPPIYS